jgi:hypothetical protein
MVSPQHDLPVEASPDCGTSSIAILVAQSVPSATLLPCVATVPAAWSIGDVHVRRGGTDFELSFDSPADPTATAPVEIEVSLRPRSRCDVSGASPVPTDEVGTERYEDLRRLEPGLTGTRFYVFPGGCVTYRYEFTTEVSPSLLFAADAALAFQPRQLLVDYVRGRSGGELCGAGVSCID